MPRFRRGASSTPRPRDSSADGPGILDGPVKPDDEERRGITAPRARFCAQHAGRPAVPIAARPPRNSGAAGPRLALDDADLYRHRLGAVIRSGLADADQRDTAPRGQAIDAIRRTNDFALIFLDAGTGQAILIGQSIEQDGHESAFAPPCVLQRLRAHPDVFGGVGDRGVAHQLAQSPGVHAAIGLHRSRSMP